MDKPPNHHKTDNPPKKSGIALELSSQEQGSDPSLNPSPKQSNYHPGKSTQTKIDIFLNRVRHRNQMIPQVSEQADKNNKNKQKRNFRSQFYPNNLVPKQYPDHMEGKQTPNKNSYNFGTFLRKKQEHLEKKKEEQKIKKQKQKAIQIQKQKQRKKEEAQRKLADLSAVFSGFGTFGNISEDKVKAKVQEPSLKNIDIFNQLNEDVEAEKIMNSEQTQKNRQKRNNMVVKKMKLQPKQKIPSALIRLLLSFQFSTNLLVPETKRVPNIFEDQMTYKKIFHYLVTNECIADIHAKMKSLQTSKQVPVPIEIMSYRKNSEGMVELILSQISNDKFDLNDKQKFMLKNFSLSKNRLGVITNLKKFDMKHFGIAQQNKKIFVFLCLLITPETKEQLRSNVKAIANFQIPDFQLTLKICRSGKAYFFDLDKISTHIRQYLAISNLYDNDISSFVYNPALLENNHIDIIHEHERKSLEPILQKLKINFNQTQYESIRQMVIRQSGIVLLQGPPGTGKTTTLMGLLAAQYFYLKFVLNKEEKQKILVCAPSNAAVDHITKRLVRQGLISQEGKNIFPKILRVGLLESDDKDVRSVYLDDLCEQDVEKEKINSIRKNDMTTVQIKEKLIFLSKERKKLILKGETEKTLDFDLQEKKITTEIRRYEAMLFEHKKQKVQLKKLYHAFENKRLSEADIILTTLSSSGSDKFERIRGFIGCLIVDEAAQSTQPNILIPLQTGVKKVLLVGDPCQLPSTTISQDSPVTLFNRSIFQRFLDCGIKPYFLNIQYRMAPLIRQFCSQTFYSNRLIDANVIESRYKLEQSYIDENSLKSILPFCGRNAIFIDVKYGIEQLKHNSYLNYEQATTIKQVVHKFIKNSNLSIGIITPYQAQRKLLISELKNTDTQVIEEEALSDEEGMYSQSQPILSENVQNLMINTVDSFQGQQKDIIIVSMVRANEKGDIGFMKDERRINVALTRSKHILIVIGNGDTLGSNETWDKFLKWTSSKQLYYPIQNGLQVKRLTKKVFEEKYKHKVNWKEYRMLSQDERKKKRKQIKRQDFKMGKPKKKVKKDEEQVEVQREKNDYNMDIEQSKLIIEENRQKQQGGVNFQEINKRIKDLEQNIMSGNSGMSQLFQM